ncbi:MAG: hypothetical protein EA384_09665 [Spirochaetaceae bacterium]|nr:MAG: hypothetical protein EA384_09665 [Spirochaetaceae bacterium]
MSTVRSLNERLPVLSFMVDTEDQLSLPGLCRILQDAAWKHAAALGFGPAELDEHGQMWLLSRLMVRAACYPHWGEEITIRTWPSGIERLFAMRDFRLDSAGRPVALVRSAWLVVDAASRRPVPPERVVNADQYRGVERVFDELPPRLSGPDGGAPEVRSHRVVYSDFDRQRHVNNVQYLQWMLDGFPMQHLRQHSVAEAVINFNAEALYDETLSVRLQDDGSFSVVGVFRDDQAVPLCSARLLWRRRQGTRA